MPSKNLFKIGVATAAAAVCAILAITAVFAHSTPTGGRSVVGSLVNAANAASFPVFANDPAPNALTDEQAQDAEEAAELAAEIAAQQQELAAEKAAEAAAEAAEAAEADEDADKQETADTDQETHVKKTQPTTEHHDSGSDHESD